jgi:chemotaxis protein MotB
VPGLSSVERRRQVRDMAHRGVRDVVMARRLGVSLSTIEADLKAVGVGHGGGGGGARWLVSYADFVTLMFGFFLILWASATQDPVKFSELALAFQRAFNNGQMIGQQGTGEIIGEGGRMGQIMISPFQRISETAGEVINQMGLTDEVSVGMRKDGLVVSLSGSLLFDSGKADLRPEAADVLSRLSNLLEPTDGKIKIEGHTDNIPFATKEMPSNWELSANRAAAVLRYFTETVGLPPERFEAAGFADVRPIASNDTREGRAKNRRVEIVLSGQPGSVDLSESAPAKPAAPAPAPAKAEPAPAVKH